MRGRGPLAKASPCKRASFLLTHIMTVMIENKINQIKKIKEKLNNQKLSVLVGAGFSLNVSNIFPTWWSLIYDIAYNLYKSEISDSYNTYLASLKPKAKPIAEKKFKEKKVGEIIDREGYLEIVTRYIKKQGIREAITTYIESKTPQIEKRDDKFLLRNKSIKKSSIELTDKLLSQHKMLLQLPWNNVYTTNYDTLLEQCVDNDMEEELKKRISDLEEANEEKILTEQNLIKRFLNITEIESTNNVEIDKFENTLKSLSLIDKTQIDKQKETLDELLKRKTRIARVKSEINFKISSANREIQENDSTLQKLNSGLNECLTIVRHSSELKIKRNKNIIKLHGTLRSSEDDDFGFDGDVHKQYVIAKEDYDTYPLKHEAFTQLMRISLLQESYVLIGFSGVDPNFISWIGWVRDILERKPESNYNDYKVYLIDVNTKPITEDKKLFYKNHRIIHIPLLDEKIINFLESESKFKIKDRRKPKEVFELFFKYLSKNISLNKAKYTLEVLQRNEYRSLWNSIKILKPQEFDSQLELSKVQKLEELHKSERIPSFNFAYAQTKEQLLFYSNALLDFAKGDNKKLTKLSKLICIAVQDAYLTPSFIWNENDLTNFIEKIKGQFAELSFEKAMVRECVLSKQNLDFEIQILSLSTIKGIDKDFIDYESILMSAFSFDFKTLYKKVQSWSPKSNRAINKAGFLSIFHPNQAEKYLSIYCNNFETATNQEQLYAIKLLRYISQAVSWSSQNKELNEKIKDYESLGINSFDDNITYILDEFEKSKTKIKPYGEGRFSVGNKMYFSNDLTKPQKGLQFIQMFIETGYPLSLPSVHYKSHEKWYLILKSIFEFYPFPVLFYTLQYSNEKFLRRVAQDYIYSDALKEDIPVILNLLLDAYIQKETPINFKRNILVFTSELFIASPPSEWQQKFIKIWKLLLKNNSLFVERHFEEKSFVEKALPYILEISAIRKIIYDILSGYEANQNTAIGYLYNLANNNILKVEGKRILNKNIKEKLETIIESIPDSPTVAIFILGNLSSVLLEKDKSEIKNNLANTDLFKIENERIWSVILYFSYGDKTIHKKIKNAIIKSDKLWYSGITDKGVSMGQYEFINLQNLIKKTHRTNGLIWTKTESKKIFYLLINEFEKIKKTKSKMNDINFKSILEEMYHFLINEEKSLIDIPEYKVVFNEIETNYKAERNYATLYEGLLSEESSTVIWALGEMFSDIYREDKVLHENELQLLLNKIYFQKEPSLEACLSYTSNMFSNYKTNLNLRKYSNQLIQILIKYQKTKLLEYDKPFVEKRLIMIAKVLNEWNEKNVIVTEWLEKESNTNYNNIKLNIS